MQSLLRRAETTPANFAELAAAAFAARRTAGIALVGSSGALTQTCRSMAKRFHSGGKLFAFGDGLSSTDAAHIAVEFVHPVIVGKRALPAFALSNHAAALSGIAGRMGWEQVYAHQLRTLARPGDIALALVGEPVPGDAAAAIEAARDLGLLTIALTTGGAAVKADHVLPVQSNDPKVVKELRVTMYHLLWELVHVFLEQPELLRDWENPVRQPETETAGGFEALYPFLYAGRNHLTGVLDQITASTVAKVQEIVALRERMAEEQTNSLIHCAKELATCFNAGARLYSFGNGGSSTDAQALAELFFLPPAGFGLPALCLTDDVAVVTALSNDIGFDVIFARQLAAFGTAGDVAVGLSTSGNSENLLRAFDEAHHREMLTIGFAGNDGGKMAESRAIRHLFVVPSSSVHRTQEAQTTLVHVLWELTQAALAETRSARTT